MTDVPQQSGVRLGRRGIERLDLLLLTIEALDLNGGEAMLWTSQQMGMQTQFPNRVELWKRRCHNPLRRTTRREPMAPVDAESLICLVCAMAERLYPMLHQLLSSREPDQLTQQRWNLLDERLRDLVEERMNPRRGAVMRLLDPMFSAEIQRQLVGTLALVAGPGGIDRLRATLLDPTP
ncbi:DUF3038 domain-containing protein [Synechococcus sp. MIT S1220]|uniref:DUF3038 domain-containing protein n=1 Tax=Synechococcus sp. MIT S1220 TaxID=3082549 RepID=UPI0039B0C500